MVNSYEDIRLYLPRSFHGPITVKIKHGGVRISKALSKSLTILRGSDNAEHLKNFIFFRGDISRWLDDKDSWKGDEVIVDQSYANFGIGYDDEVDVWC